MYRLNPEQQGIVAEAASIDDAQIKPHAAQVDRLAASWFTRYLSR